MNHAWIGVLETTPLSPVWVAVSERGLVAVEFGEEDERRMTNDEGALKKVEARAEAIMRVLNVKMVQWGAGAPAEEGNLTAMIREAVEEYFAGGGEHPK